MGLIQLHPPSSEPISLDQAKTYLRIDHDDEDQFIGQIIRSARQAIESYTVRSLVRQAWRFTFNEGFANANREKNHISGVKNYFEYGIELPRSPSIELIETPKLMDSYGAHALKDYRLDNSGRVARLYFASQILHSLDGHGIIQVDFWAGYSENAADIPEPLRHAILMMIAQLYINHTCANDNGFITLPLTDGILQIIKPYRIFRLQ